jgi:hypothetical protein
MQSAIKVGPPAVSRLQAGNDLQRSSSLFRKTDQCNMAGPLDRNGQLPLVTQAITRNASRHDPAAFRQEIP